MKPERITALADGIFAIAMTLLVLEIKVPLLHESLGEGLVHVLPNVLSLVMSFVLLAIYWSSHHLLFAGLSKGDLRFMWRNIWFFLCITLVPFAAALLGEYYLDHLAQTVFALILILCGSLLYSCIFYAIRKGHLLNEPSVEFRRNVAGKILLPPLVYILAILVGFWDTRVSLVLLAFGPASYFIPIDTKTWNLLTKPFAKYIV